MIANFAVDGHPARLDGPAAARDRGGDRRVDRRRQRRRHRGRPDVAGRARAAARLAVDVPRLPGTSPSATAKCFAGGWYLTGDLATRDADGYFWFVGRKDDVIKTSGHLIGPFEVESVLMEHPAVAEAGVIGKPDPVALEVVKAFVALKDGYAAERSADARAAGACAQAPRRRRRAEGDRVRRVAAAARAAARSCGGCSRRASWDCPRATRRRWRATDERRRIPATRRPAARPRALELLREMLRIRRFEEKSAELYSAGQDPRLPASVHRRGSGRRRRDAGAHAGRRDRRHLPRARPRARARHPGRRGHGGDVRQGERLQPRARRLDAPLRRRRGASTAATRSSAADCRSPSASRSPTSMQRRARVTACFFGEGAVAEGEFHESLNLAALWQLPVLFLCENNLYAMGTALARSESETDIHLKAQRYGIVSAESSTAWTCSRSRRPSARRRTRCAPATARSSSSSGRIASARIRCPTPSSTARTRRSTNGNSATRSRRSRRCCAPRPCSTTRAWREWRPRSRRRSRRPCAAADAGPWEPVDDLARDVYTPVAA